MSSYIKLEGEAELQKLLTGLGEEVNNKSVIKSALRRAAKPLIHAARKNVEGTSVTVAKSIDVNYTNREGDTIGVGPIRKLKKNPITGGKIILRDPWYAHFIEWGVSGVGRFKGTRSSWTGKRGDVRSARPEQRRRYRADQPARPFMRPAYAQTAHLIAEDFGKAMKEALDKYIERKRKNVT